MIPSILLGLRLTGAGAGPARLRSALVALAAAVGAVVLLGLMAAARAEQHSTGLYYSRGELARLLLAVIGAVALPVLVLAGTAARLSARLRDRRLANLRLLGLSPGRTRLVAVTEAAAATVVGLAAGWLLFTMLRPTLAALDPVDRGWTGGTFAPRAVDQAVVLLALLVAVVVVAGLPHRLDMTAAMARTRSADAGRPSLLRLVPLLGGGALALAVVWLSARDDFHTTNVTATLFFVGCALLAVGLVLAVPVLVRVLADLLLRASSQPAATLAGRRLQAQPAGVARVVAALLVGLFLVTGARAVVVSFETTPQYLQAERQLTDGQRVALGATVADAEELAGRATAVEGVTDAVALPRLVFGDCLDGDVCLQAIVATCADLARAAPGVTGCREGTSMWMSPARLDGTPDGFAGTTVPDRIAWHGAHDFEQAGPVVATLPPPTASLTTRGGSGSTWFALEPVNADVLIPPSALEAGSLPADTSVDLLVLGEPGRLLGDRLTQAGIEGSGGWSAYGFEDYDFVAGLRTLLWSVAAVVLSVGLLAFAVAAIDRAVARRRELAALQLVGVPRSLLRRAQWIEAGLPVAVGTLLAIGLGFLAGWSYLALAEEQTSLPWQQSLALAAVSAVAAVVIAGLTVVAAAPRLRPDAIRTE